jgi:RNA polymerase sigma-70 factor (ECF subfamily)
MKPTYDDQTLISLLQDPETQREGFECLVRQYSEPLYRQIRRMVVSHEDADDILQNTWIKAWGSIEYFRGDARLMTWLYRIAINESLTFLNQRRAKEGLSLDELDAERLALLESDPYVDADRAQRLLAQAVQQLPEKQRITFQMKYFDELKYERISEVMGTSVGALKASYHHAVKKITQFLKENGGMD